MCFTCFAQAYTPKLGETVMHLSIEGRGDVYIVLYTKEAPKTTAHIISLVRQGFYNDQRFHRVEKSPRPYLVQVGDPISKTDLNNPQIGLNGSGEKVPYEETSFTNGDGAVGLVRTLNDRNSGDSQFYMLLAPARFLDGSYTVFGQVVSGLDVLQKIERGDRIKSASILP